MPSAPNAEPSRAAHRAAPRALPAALIAAAICAAIASACAGGDPPQLLAADFRGNATLLHIVDPGQPSAEGRRLAVIEHAEGWAPVSEVSPDRSAVALLVLPPGRTRPRTQAALEVLTAEDRVRIADGLDLNGGVVWSDDGGRLLVRADEGAGDVLLVLDSETGRLLARRQTPAASSLYPLAMRGDRVWSVESGAGGARFAEWTVSAGEWTAGPVERIDDEGARDWTISPDRRSYGYIARRGSTFELVVGPLGRRQMTYQVADTAGATRPLRSPGDRLANAASPVWTGDDSLIVGTWSGATRGFALPVAWDSENGRTAARWFSGTGPGDTGSESAALIGADGEITVIDDPQRRLIGWWRE